MSQGSSREGGSHIGLAGAGAAIAVVASMCGVGGGLFAVPLLHYLQGLELRRAVATSLCLVFATSLSSTAVELLHPDSALVPSLAGALIVGALLGARLGHGIARHIPVHRLRILFAVVLAVVGTRLLLNLSASGDGVVGTGSLLADGVRAPMLATVLGTGFLSGILVPVLGVGGGLVAVPAQLLLAPEIGYLGARASSLAMASVTSGVSILQYAREGRIDGRRGAWFAGGAVAGAILGVWTVHLPGAAVVAQALLAMILFIAATRFAFDARQRRGGGVRQESAAPRGAAEPPPK